MKKLVKLLKKSPVESLNNGFLTGKELIFTDLENTIIVKNYHVSAPCVVPINIILSDNWVNIKVLNNYTRIELTKGNKKVTVDTGFDISELPEINTNKTTYCGNFTPDDIQHLAHAVKFASKDELRPAMYGVYIELKKIIATNGHYLYFNDFTENNIDNLITPETIKILSKLKTDNITIYKNDDNLIFETDKYGILQNRINQKYPDWRNVIPKKFDKTISINKKDLLNILKETKEFDKKQDYLYIDVTDYTMTIKKQSEDAMMELKTKLTGNVGNFRFGIDENYLITVIKAIPADVISWQLIINEQNEVTKAMLLNNNYLLMPKLYRS